MWLWVSPSTVYSLGYHSYEWLDDKRMFTHRGTAQSTSLEQTCFLTQPLCVKVFDRMSPCAFVWESSADFDAAGLTHPDVVCTRPGRGWLITPYLPWRIRALIEHGLVTDPFLCPWKAWPALWLLPCDEWLHFGPDHAVGRLLSPWLMALGCWTASRRSLLTWSDSAGYCQGPAASAANTDSCKERGASFKHTDPARITQIAHFSNFGFTGQIISCCRCAPEQGI